VVPPRVRHLTRLVVSDVDGTLVTSDKVLTDASIEAVARLRASGIDFAVTSGRPPRGMSMLFEPLDVTAPVGGFNGALLVEPSMQVLEERALSAALVTPIMATLSDFGLDVWLYQGVEWLVLDLDGDHVQREAFTVQFEPTRVTNLAGRTDGVVKIVGVSDDAASIDAATTAVRSAFGADVSATTSQPYYLDVTHPLANKGMVVRYLSTTLGIPLEQIATIGDGPNDALMFAQTGLSIAMGNAAPDVQRAADVITSSNDDDGFAAAIEQYVLGA
jgi:Cof subfamily protein (haloacid dehalogenase superfamily)